MRDLVYISCHPEDAPYLRQLRDFLRRDVRLADAVWDATEVPAGSNRKLEIERHIQRAKVVVMLVSQAYLRAEGEAWKHEALPFFESQERGELTILWIPLEQVSVAATPLAEIQPVGGSDRPWQSLSDEQRNACWEEVRAQTTLLLERERTGAFDIFLSHSGRDKPLVRQLAQLLKKRGLKVWLDEEQLRPGEQWVQAIEQAIRTTRVAAVLVGPTGLGPWEKPELSACLMESVRRGLTVIPVLLPGVREQPDLPVFLAQFSWLDLRDGLTDAGVNRLIQGVGGTLAAGPSNDSGGCRPGWADGTGTVGDA